MKNNAISRRTLLKGALFTAGSVIASPVIGQSSKTNSLVGSVPRIVASNAPNISYGPAFGVAKLNANENPYGPSPLALRAMEEAIKMGSYYVQEVPRLKEMIAERNNVTPEHIIIGSGSSAPLQWLATKVTQKGHILGPDLFWDTTSKMGSMNSEYGIKRLDKTSDLAIDLDDMYDSITSTIGMVQVTNPNNPRVFPSLQKHLGLSVKKHQRKRLY